MEGCPAGDRPAVFQKPVTERSVSSADPSRPEPTERDPIHPGEETGGRTGRLEVGSTTGQRKRIRSLVCRVKR